MSNEPDRRVKELFLLALEQSSAEVETWLRSQCGEDDQLFDEVMELIHQDQATFDLVTPGTDLTSPGSPDQTRAGSQSGLHVRCPHCHYPIELVDETSLEEVICESCGSSFSLIASNGTHPRSTDQPTRIAHFELQERVGVGAFGTVYKALDTELDRTVAVKIPRKGQLSDSEAEKFLREARTAAQLKHPNIVAVHEVGRDGDRVYIVSDFIDGTALSDWLVDQQPSIREAVALCCTISQALQYAHANGVIHRDLKPGNIMLDRENRPYLMDFGLAKREAGEITMTIDGQILGTPAYMSPEQARGTAHAATAATDIYAMGGILFEMLTGERPFRGNARMLLHQVLTEEAPSPRKYNAAISRDLETVCLKCLEKQPAARYESAEALVADLHSILNDEPIAARPVSRPERFWRWCKKEPTVAALTALLIVALLSGTAISNYYAYVANERSKDAVRATEQARATAVEALTNLGDLEARRGQWRSALRRYEKAIEGSGGPVPPALLRKRVRALWVLGETSAARKELEILLSSGSPSGQTLLLAADVVSTEKGSIKESFDYVRQAIDSGELETWERNFAQAILASDPQEALQYLEIAVEENPLDPSVNQLYILLLAFNGKVDQVGQKVNELRRLAPEDPQFIQLESYWLAISGQKEKLEQNLDLLAEQLEPQAVSAIRNELIEITSNRSVIELVLKQASGQQAKLGGNFDQITRRFDGTTLSAIKDELIEIASNRVLVELTLKQLSDWSPDPDPWTNVKLLTLGVKGLQNPFRDVGKSFARWSDLPYVTELKTAFSQALANIVFKRFPQAKNSLQPLLTKFRIHEVHLLYAQVCHIMGKNYRAAGYKRKATQQQLEAEERYRNAITIAPLFVQQPPIGLLNCLDIQQELVSYKQVTPSDVSDLSKRAKPIVVQLSQMLTNPSHRWHQWALKNASKIAAGSAATRNFDEAFMVGQAWRKLSPNTFDSELMARVYFDSQHFLEAIESSNSVLRKDVYNARARKTRDQAIEQIKKHVAESEPN